MTVKGKFYLLSESQRTGENVDYLQKEERGERSSAVNVEGRHRTGGKEVAEKGR